MSTRDLTNTERDYFIAKVKNTVGYAESDNKAEFMKGALVGIDVTGEKLCYDLDVADRAIVRLTQAHKALKEKCKQLVEILNFFGGIE